MASVRSFVKPLRLFRFRSLEEIDRELSAIEHCYIHCSSYDDLNDPMEGLFSSSRTLKESEGYRALRNEIRHTKREIGVCSFSEVHNHAAMWAYYADQYRGMCVSYSLTKLLKHLSRGVDFVRMAYVEEMPTVRRTKDGAVKLAKSILSCKHYQWLHEREWRMLAPLGNGHYHEVGCVTRIYLGSKVEAVKRGRVIELAERLGIAVSEMNVDEYRISFSELSPDLSEQS